MQPCCWLMVGACTLPTLPWGGARNGGSGSVAPVLGPTPALDCWGRGRHVCPGWLSVPLHSKGTGHELSGASLVWKVPSRPLCRLHLVVAGTEMPETSMGGPESRPVEGPGNIGRVWGEWRPADSLFDTEWFVSRPVDRLQGGRGWQLVWAEGLVHPFHPRAQPPPWQWAHWEQTPRVETPRAGTLA